MMTPKNILKLTDLYNVQCIAFAWHREATHVALCTNAMARRGTLFGKQAKSSESLVNLRGLGKWLFGAKTRLLAVP